MGLRDTGINVDIVNPGRGLHGSQRVNQPVCLYIILFLND